MECRNKYVYLYELAKVFAKHNFFNDFDPVDDSYITNKTSGGAK